jgi:hypothetical protein
MNERIKELAEQAGFCMWKEEKWNPGDVIDWSCRYDDELEKFFDLIVWECIRTIQMGITRDGQNTEKYLRSMKHLKDIKERFGVEE